MSQVTITPQKNVGFKRKSTFSSSQVSKKIKWGSVPRGQAGGTVTRIKQVVGFGTATSVATTDTLGAYSFRLADLPNAADLVKMFDYYRIDKVQIHFIPDASNIPTVGGAAVQKRCYLYTAKDYNDATTPTLITDVMQYQTCKFTPYLEKHVRSIKPQTQATNVDGTVSIANNSSWVSTGSPNVKWYGLKVGISANGNSAGSVQSYIVHCVYYLSFKNIQ